MSPLKPCLSLLPFTNVSFSYPEPISSIRSPCILLHPLPPSLFGGSFVHHCFNFWRLLLLWHRKKEEGGGGGGGPWAPIFFVTNGREEEE